MLLANATATQPTAPTTTKTNTAEPFGEPFGEPFSEPFGDGNPDTTGSPSTFRLVLLSTTYMMNRSPRLLVPLCHWPRP